ncbi:MAG: HAMP domain-containing histidine kinase [Prevotellaceae bacterium]|jgi:signal transduction histidine kinase|nr:HAMP domain-containing histidine kinase [Prevotellaceae bacterium]
MATGLKTKLSFHKRLLIFLLLALCFFLLCFFIFQYHREKIFKAEQLNYKLQLFNTQIGNVISDRNAIALLVAEKQKSEFENLRVTVIDSLGNVVFDTEQANFSFSNHSNRPEIKTALKAGTAYTVRRHSETTNSDYFYSSKKINGHIVRSAIPYNMPLVELLKVDKDFLWFMIIVAAIIGIVTYAFTQQLGQNIKRLRQFALRAEKGEIIDENEDFHTDELGEISRFIVQIYSRLQQAKIDLDKEKQEILFYENEKNRIKKQLTQNINHELKTPVSSIHGYLETILRNPDISKEQILDFIHKSYQQTNRLSQLLKDVATLTRIDEATPLIEKQSVDIREIISEIINDTALLPADKRMRITSNINKPIIVHGNPALLHSIFRNLTDNAITHSGGRDIFINLTGETDKDYMFSFSDNGIGVEDKYLPRIFERFYRIDKGRSRKLGGTGLGLSIVKNAIIFHGGAISAKISPSGGLEFVFNIKK